MFTWNHLSLLSPSHLQALVLWYVFKCLYAFFPPSGTSDDDLEFYVRKCGEILGVTVKLDKDQRDAKHILEHIFFQVVAYKKLNQVSWVCISLLFLFQIS